MYLSRIALNTKRRETMQALDTPQWLHGALERSFSGERERNLWRIDWLGDNCYLLVLSAQKPDFTSIVQQFGFPNAEHSWEIRNYDPLLGRLQAGQVWRFRLRANPVHSSAKEKDGPANRGKVYAHVTPEQQRQWLLSRAQSLGFTLAEDGFDVVHTQWKKFRKRNENNREVTLRTATYEGVLTISDPERFRQALLFGIGRAKAYGCGLMTIIRCED
jgi:CRISPR system Cascade subunit CasE